MNGCPYGDHAFRVISGFGPCADPLTGVFGRKVSVRLSGVGGKTLTALYSGRVVLVSQPEEDTSCGGYAVTVLSPGGIEVTFSGLRCLSVRAGMFVSAGEELGLEGDAPVSLTVLCRGCAINPLECLGVPNRPGVYEPCGGRTALSACGFRRGDLVRIGNPVRYGTGRRFQPYSELYEVMGVAGDRVTVGIGGEEIASVRGCDLYPV